MFTKANLTVISIDLARKTCSLCDNQSYPSIFGTLRGEVEYGYICKECLIHRSIFTEREVNSLVENFTCSRVYDNYIKSTWVSEDKSKKDLLDKFLLIEEEDSKLIKSQDLMKATVFNQELSKGNVIYSEEEMYEYFSFYGNNPEIIFTLRKELEETPSDKFLKSIYIESRTRELSVKQIEALKKRKSFKFMSSDLEEFWDNLPCILDYIATIRKPNSWIIKIKNIIDLIISSEFYTLNQKTVVDKFIRLHNIKPNPQNKRLDNPSLPR